MRQRGARQVIEFVCVVPFHISLLPADSGRKMNKLPWTPSLVK